MRVTICAINVGRGEGNRTVVMELLSYVDLFFIIDPPLMENGECVENEVRGYELFSFVKNGDVEVFVKSGITGWIEVVEHDENTVVLEYKTKEGNRKVGGTYWRPHCKKEKVERWLERVKDCDMIMGDFNARSGVWGQESGDRYENDYGRLLKKWTMDNNFEVHEYDQKTFRQTSTIDLTIKKKGRGLTNKPKLTDCANLEHCGQIMRVQMEKPQNSKEEDVAWKRVDWNKVEGWMKEVSRMKVEERWEGMCTLMRRLPKKKNCSRRAPWWDEKLEGMLKDVKRMRRDGDENWKLARKIARNAMIQKRYETMKENLSRIKDPEMFKVVKNLEGKRSLPPMVNENGNIIYKHEEVCEMIAKQLNPIEEAEWTKEEIDICIDENDIRKALKSSPPNTASGIDGMSYPLLRFWNRKEKDSMKETIQHLIKHDDKRWHRAETVLIRKGDKERYDVVKSWRMIHLLPTAAKVAERIILEKIASQVDLEETQFGSRKNRSTSDAMKQIMEFVEYSKGMKIGILSMDVEGGFDRVDIDKLCDIMMMRGCPENLTRWTRRWAMNRSVRFRFNNRISKVYHLNKGVPQGSPLSPFLFGIYVADIFRPRFETRPKLRCMISSYVDDGAVVVATNSVNKTKRTISILFEECCKVARERGMSFSSSKTDWMGMDDGEKWGKLELGGMERKGAKEIRVLGYRIGQNGKWDAHLDYWIERGNGVRERIASVGRRYGSKGGIGAWECFRLIQGAYIPTVTYGLEFVDNENGKEIHKLQVNVNDTIRSIFRTPIKLANNILLAETGIPPIEIQKRFMERNGYLRQLKYAYGKDLPWFGCIGKRWKCDQIKCEPNKSTTELERRPIINIGKTKEKALEYHQRMWEKGKEVDELWVYTDGSKSSIGTAMAWVVVEGDELVEEERGWRVPEEWSIVKTEIGAIMMALKDL